MKYTVYKITNLLDGKIYIGAHKTNDLDDGYMGSGKYLKNAQEKYGIENFEKEILQIFDNSEEMFNMESKLVNEDFVKNKETYNLKEGGFGGFDYLNNPELFVNPTHTSEHGKMMRSKGKDKRLAALRIFFSDPEKMRKRHIKMVNTRINIYGTKCTRGFTDKKHTDESKRKIGEANSKHQKGKSNSQYGTIWICNLEEKVSKKIKKEEFPEYESLGWLRGRKIKF